MDAAHSNDQLPVLAPPAEDPFTNPPEYYALAPTISTNNPRSVRFHSPPADTPYTDADAQSLLPAYSPPYRGYASQEEYLAALRAW